MDNPLKKLLASPGKPSKLRMNAVYAFVGIFLALVVWEALVVKDSISIVLELENQPAPAAASGKGVRINFTDYDQIVQRIDKAASFQPTGGVTTDPFAK